MRLAEDARAATNAANDAAADVLRRAEAGEFDGAPGLKGEQGERGEQGIPGTPGKDGAPGMPGAKGEPGRTPVRGVDYWTAEDRAPIEAATEAAKQAAAEAAANRLKGEAVGKMAHAEDVFAAPALGLTVYGASTQDGTPSPDAPAPISSVTSAEMRIAGEDMSAFDALPLDLAGHELRSLPNGVRDEVRIDASGNVELTRRVARKAIVGADVNSCDEHSGVHQRYASVPIGAAESTVNARNMMCSRYSPSLWTTEDEKAYMLRDAIIMNDSRFVDIETARRIMDEEEPVVIYELATPEVIPLGKVELPALPAPVANAWVESDVPTECAVRYVRDANVVIGRLEEKLATVAAAAI